MKHASSDVFNVIEKNVGWVSFEGQTKTLKGIALLNNQANQENGIANNNNMITVGCMKGQRDGCSWVLNTIAEGNRAEDWKPTNDLDAS